MTNEQSKEKLSEAYVRAVAATAGCSVSTPEIDDASIDIRLHSSKSGEPIEDAMLEVQLKATSRTVVRDDHIAFPLSIKNYNDLRKRSTNPRMLIVMLVPPLKKDWLVQTADSALVRHCAYWVSLTGSGETQNSTSVTVQVPLKNVFSAITVRNLMNKAHKGVRP